MALEQSPSIDLLSAKADSVVENDAKNNCSPFVGRLVVGDCSPFVGQLVVGARLWWPVSNRRLFALKGPFSTTETNPKFSFRSARIHTVDRCHEALATGDSGKHDHRVVAKNLRVCLTRRFSTISRSKFH